MKAAVYPLMGSVAVLAVAAALAACGDDSSGGAASGDGPITVGLLTSLTGPAAPQGTNIRRSAELAAAKLGSDVGRPVKLEVQDDQSDPQVGVTAFSQMVNAKGLKGIVGPGPSSVGMALKPVAKRQQIVLLAPGVSAPDYTEADGYTFRTWIASDDLEGSTAKYLTEKMNSRTLGILAENADTFQANAAIDKKIFQDAGGHVTGEEFVDGTQTDFLPQLTKLVAGHPDVLMLEFTAPASIGNAVKQARQLGFKGPVLTSNNATNPEFLAAAKSAADGTYWTVPAVLNNATNKSFAEAYRGKYKADPDTLAASAYDDVMLMGKAIAEVGNDGPAIRDWLAKQKDYDGVSGPITFTPEGALEQKPVSIQTVKNGKITVLSSGLS